eukprot:s3707_g1.t1
MGRRRIVGKSAPRVAALEGQREVYDDDLIVDLGETSDLEEEAEQLEVGLDVLSPRVACLGTSSRVGEVEQRGGQDNEMNPEDYAKEILYEEEDEGGLWTQLAVNEEVNEDEVTIVMNWERDLKGCWALNQKDYAKEILYEEEDVDEEMIKRLFELLPSQQFARKSTETSEGEMHPKAWASGAYRHGEGGNQTETDLELETSESIMYIRMSEEEWVTTSQTHGLNHYIPAMATRWRTIQPADEDLNSVIPAAIQRLELALTPVKGAYKLVSDDFQELQLGTLLALRSYRVPDYDPEGRNASFIKAFKIRNDVLNIEEVIVLWIHRSH